MCIYAGKIMIKVAAALRAALERAESLCMSFFSDIAATIVFSFWPRYYFLTVQLCPRTNRTPLASYNIQGSANPPGPIPGPGFPTHLIRWNNKKLEFLRGVWEVGSRGGRWNIARCVRHSRWKGGNPLKGTTSAAFNKQFKRLFRRGGDLGWAEGVGCPLGFFRLKGVCVFVGVANGEGVHAERNLQCCCRKPNFRSCSL